MKKKIKPADQTEELNRANFEFIKRNEQVFRKIIELLDQNEKRRDELSTDYATLDGKFYPKIKEALDFLLSDYPVDKDFAEYLEKESIPPAANAMWEWMNYIVELQMTWENYNILKKGMRPGVESVPKIPLDKLKKMVIELYCRDAKEVFEKLTNRDPSTHLLIGVDLTRNKDVIIEEVRKLVTHYQNIMGLDEIKKSRLKWLPITNELLEVWDLYDQEGQKPTKMTFKMISKKVGRPLSTVKTQWRSAYKKIFGKAYDPEIKYTTEEKKAKATELCANCPHEAKCYKKGDWFPCADYLRIAGKEKYEKDHLEFKDELYDKDSYKLD